MQALKESVLAGSLDALETIVYKIEHEKLLLVPFLPMFAQLLGSTRVPDCASSNDVKRRFLVVTKQTFRAVAIALSRGAYRELIAQLVSSLPDMCNSAMAFFRIFVLDTVSLSPSDAELVREMKETILPASIDRIFRIEPTFELASKHTGLFGCLTRMWVRMVTEQQPPTVVDRYMTLIVEPRISPNTPAENEFGDALEELPERVISFITIFLLQRIIEDLHSTPIEVESVRVHVAMLIQGGMNSVQMCNACFASHVPRWCCVVLKRLTSRRHVLPAGCEYTVTRTVEITLILLEFMSQAGWSIVMEPLECGFLDCVFRCQPLLDYQERASHQETLGASLVQILDLYNACTVHRRVLRAAHKAIRAVLRRNLEDHLKQKGPVWDAWERLKIVVGERWQAKEDYILAGPKDWCDNEQCRVFASPGNKLQQCGCASSYYCSRSCQRASWKSGHKALCEVGQKVLQACAPLSTTARDTQFFVAMAQGDYRLHSDNINKLTNNFIRARRSSAVLPFPIVILFDYVSVPRRVMITTADRIPKEDDLDGLVEKARRNLGQLVYLTVEDNAREGKALKFLGLINQSQ